MENVFEVYLTKKKITEEEWLGFIKTISNYTGILKKWKLWITTSNNQIRYFIITKCSLPATLNNLNSFLLKKTSPLSRANDSIAIPFLWKKDKNLIELLNYFEVKNKGTVESITMSFQKIYKNKIKRRANFYVNQNKQIKKYRIFHSNVSLLAIDFEGNKRYFYKSAPKYLDINKILHLLNSDESTSILQVDTFPYLQGKFYLNANNFDFDKHSILLGASGSGKSKFLSFLIHMIYKSDNLRQHYKIVCLDPHAALEGDIGGFSKVIDFKTEEDSIHLFQNKKENLVSSTELLLGLLKPLMNNVYNAKLERVLRHSIYLLLTDETFNFVHLKKVLLDLEERNDLVKKHKYHLPESVIDFFLTDFNDLKTKSYNEAIAPIIAFIDEMEMLPVFHEQKKEQSLKEVIQENAVTLFSLDRLKLGDKVTQMISGLIMQQMFTLIQSYEIEHHIILIVDEVSIVENPILSRFLSEARKYNLSVILVGQYFNQISDDLKNAIFSNVINYYIFRVSKLDANILADNFNMSIPLENTKENKVKLLTELSNRECIVRMSYNGVLFPAFKATTLNFESIPRIKKENRENLSQKKNVQNKTNKFEIGKNIPLKDILISNSSSRKVVKK